MYSCNSVVGRLPKILDITSQATSITGPAYYLFICEVFNKVYNLMNKITFQPLGHAQLICLSVS